jgi:integration host factor subunit alpha
MSVNKKRIIRNLSNQTSISALDASYILDFFIETVKSNAISKKVKLSGFGCFNFKKTPKRVGRNPKTGESYIISELNKLNLKPSNKIKEILNK